MLALLLLGSVFASYPQCNNVTSCYAQVNGTQGLNKLVGTLPNGGVGKTFTTQDCMRGLIAISETCECQNTTMWASQYSPQFCYSSGEWANKQATDYKAFCSNQNGLNTFSLLNSTDYTQCKCFDPISGREETASIKKPVCKLGRASYKPCVSIDGKGDNAAVLKPYTGATLKALLDIDPSPTVAFPRCACGVNEECRNMPKSIHGPEVDRYCQADISRCSRYKVCPKDVFVPKDTFADQECACGGRYCYSGTKCESKTVDGIKKFSCSLNGRSSNLVLLLKQMAGSAFLTFVFGIVTFVFMLCIAVFSILTCCKVNKK